MGLPSESWCWNERSDWSVGFSSAAATAEGQHFVYMVGSTVRAHPPDQHPQQKQPTTSALA
jgi:hypothetical protein